MTRTIPTEEFNAAYNAAPRLIQDVLNDAATDRTIDGIRSAYQLHVDITGKLSELLDKLLLGLISPSDFHQELLSLGIPSDTANAIVKEVNEKIFQPLQKRMRTEGQPDDSEGQGIEDEDEEAVYDPRFDVLADPAPQATPVAVRETPPLAPVMQVGTPTSNQFSAAPQAQPSVLGGEQAVQGNVPIYSHAAELINHQNPAMPAAVQHSAPQPVESAVSEPYLPYARTMAEDMERAAHGLTGQPATPARSFQTASVPVTFAQPRAVPAQEVARPVAPAPHTPPAPQFSAPQPFPTSQPIATPNYAVPTPPPAPMQPSAPVLAPVRLTPIDRPNRPNAPITKEFGSDPYREPISA